MKKDKRVSGSHRIFANSQILIRENEIRHQGAHRFMTRVDHFVKSKMLNYEEIIEKYDCLK